MDKLLKKLLDAFGVSGREDEIRNAIKSEIDNKEFEIKEDKLGNLIVKAGSGNERIMICAHMDSVGLISTFIEDSGYIRMGQVGSYKMDELRGNYAEFENGVIGKIGLSGSGEDLNSVFVDIGAKNRKEAVKKVTEACTARVISDYYDLNKNITGPGLDSRIGCYILLNIIKNMKESDKELYFVFSSQKQLEGRGARAAAYEIDPDYCIVLDTEECRDVPGGSGNLKLGEGPVLTVMDRTLITNHKIKSLLEEAAAKAKVKLQYGVSGEGSEGGLIHKERGGIMTGVLNVPIRYKYSASEMISLKDVENTISVVKNILE